MTNETLHAATLLPDARSATDLSDTARRSGIPVARCDALGRELPTAVDSLWRRRAWEVPEGHLDDYVTLRWMCWSSGALVLTAAGRVVHDATVARGSAL